jgi:hypothetical protein
MQRPQAKTGFCRGEACFAQRSGDEFKTIFRPILTLRLPWNRALTRNICGLKRVSLSNEIRP